MGTASAGQPRRAHRRGRPPAPQPDRDAPPRRDPDRAQRRVADHRPASRAPPGVRVEVRALSSIEIGRRLADYDLDAGVTYLDNEPLGAVVATPIYEERYLFLTQSEQPRGSTIGWSELKGVPLCLLTRDMQNRRIVDAALRDARVEAAPRVEANSISALLSFAQTGWSCVIAQTWLALQGPPAGMRSLAPDRPRDHPHRRPRRARSRPRPPNRARAPRRTQHPRHRQRSRTAQRRRAPRPRIGRSISTITSTSTTGGTLSLTSVRAHQAAYRYASPPAARASAPRLRCRSATRTHATGSRSRRKHPRSSAADRDQPAPRSRARATQPSHRYPPPRRHRAGGHRRGTRHGVWPGRFDRWRETRQSHASLKPRA